MIDLPDMPRWTGLVALALLCADAAEKWKMNLLPELLWNCPVAVGLMGVGILFGQVRLAAAGFLLITAVGVPAYTVLLLANPRDTTLLSAVLHFAGPVLGAIALWDQGLPKWTSLWAFAVLLALIPLSRLVTPAALNVNMAYGPYGPLAKWFPAPWVSYVVNLGGALAILLAFERVFARFAGR
jgi:hypothetical protein